MTELAEQETSGTEDNTDPGVSASPVKALFLGNILEDQIFPFPEVSTEEKETLAMVIESVDRFMEGRDEEFREHDVKGEQPEEYIESLKELGLFGLVIPEEYGGIGLSNSGYSRVLQQTSSYDGSSSLTIGAHSSIGLKGLLLFGTDEQKQKYLPQLATGEWVAAFCLTEPSSGSDAASIKTTAVKNNDGSWTLNGEKLWITNGPFAKFYTVFARTDSEAGKISAFIVERDYEGVSTSSKEDKMGIRASATSSVIFNNVTVPADNLLGEEGKGFKVAMSILNNGRTGLGGGCIGGMKRCIALASKQANERKQFGQKIADFEMIQEKLAQMAVDCFVAESVVSMVGSLIDQDHPDFAVEAAISKVFVSEALWRTGNEALQIAGGNGFMREYPYERIVRDSRINMIFEGTNEILRLFIALSGMKDAGAYLKEIGKSASNVFNDPIKGFGVLSGYATRKVTQLTSLGRDRLENVADEIRGDATIYEQYTLELAKSVENTLRKYGKGIIGQQLVSKRIANVAIDLFAGLCTTARISKMIQEKGADKCEQEIRISRVFAQQAKRRMNQELRRLERNETEELKGLASYISEQEKYPWDTI